LRLPSFPLNSQESALRLVVSLDISMFLQDGKKAAGTQQRSVLQTWSHQLSHLLAGERVSAATGRL
jgi:hypothetical protein